MINVRAQTFYAVFNPCGCLKTCIRSDSPVAIQLKADWLEAGLTVQTLTGQQIIDMTWPCAAHTKVTG